MVRPEQRGIFGEDLETSMRGANMPLRYSGTLSNETLELPPYNSKRYGAASLGLLDGHTLTNRRLELLPIGQVPSIP